MTTPVNIAAYARSAVVPVGGAFILVVVGFRVLVQRSQEAAERADREADAAASD